MADNSAHAGDLATVRLELLAVPNSCSPTSVAAPISPAVGPTLARVFCLAARASAPVASHPSFARYYRFQEFCNGIFNVFFSDLLRVHRLLPFCLVVEHDRKPGVRAVYS